jgi:hypothetical protein
VRRAAGRPGPFELHLREAIELNLERAPLYAALSAGASRPISRTLIRYERLLIPVARWFDRRAEPYHRAGVPLLHEAFVSMEEAPSFQEPGDPLPPPPRLRPIAREVVRRARTGLDEQGFTGAATALQHELETLAVEPVYHGMLRHMLESALRVASLAPRHERLARERGLSSPRRISERLLRLHLLGLGAAIRIDRRAEPLQRQGIGIVVRDVP